MDSEGRFGAVAAMEGFKNPIQAAQAVSDTEVPNVSQGKVQPSLPANHKARANPTANSYPGSGKDFSTSPTTDTVGCVAFDGTTFVAALSTGGMAGAHYGRVGDVPIIGSGLYAGTRWCGCRNRRWRSHNDENNGLSNLRIDSKRR